MARIVMIAWLGIMLSACSSGNSSSGSSNANSATAENISASDLYQAYKNNSRAADMTYKGKTLRVVGVYNGWAKDKDYTDLRITHWAGSEYFNVHCKSNDPQWVRAVDALKQSQLIAFIGTLDGFEDKSVNFTNCRLVQP